MADGLKDRDLQKYYEALLAMYASEGWKHFADDLKIIFDAANTLSGIDGSEMLHFRRGQIDILTKMIAQPIVTEAAYDQLLRNE
jgi:hypothetical protein